MQDPWTGLWHANITCPTCRHRHPATWTCQYAGVIAAAQRTEREEQNVMPFIPQCETPMIHDGEPTDVREEPTGRESFRWLVALATLPDEDVSDSERRVRTQAARVRAEKWPPLPDRTTVPLSSPRRGMSTSVILPSLLGHKLNNDRSVAVSTEVFWNEDMSVCPRGVKVQLLGAGGVALYGIYDGKDPFFTGWAPVPRRRPAG